MIICKNCGNVFDEKYDVCPHCGTAIMHNEAQNPYTYNMPAQMFMSQSSNIAAKKKSNIKLISIISASCLVLIGIIIALIMIFSQPNTQSQLSEQISLGEKYLTEENYEEAIVAFKKAIEIEPKDPELYIKLADAYMANGDSDNAIATLENGYKQTNDEAIKKKLDEFKTQLEYDKLISDGEKAFSDKNYTEAVKKFEKAIELKPTEFKPYISAADCYINSKDNDSAKKILEKGYEKTKSNDIKKKLDELDKIIQMEKDKKETEKYKNNIINAVLNMESEWSQFEGLQVSNIMFIDTNFDGKLEFVVQDVQHNSTTPGGNVYLLSGNNKLSKYGRIVDYELKAYYDSAANKYKLFGSTYMHIDVASNSTSNVEYIYNDSELNVEVYSIKNYYNYTGTPKIDYYNKNSNVISESEYNKINSDKLKNCVDVNMTYSRISYNEFKNMRFSEKQEALEKSYDSFTYDKH